MKIHVPFDGFGRAPAARFLVLEPRCFTCIRVCVWVGRGATATSAGRGEGSCFFPSLPESGRVDRTSSSVTISFTLFELLWSHYQTQHDRIVSICWTTPTLSRSTLSPDRQCTQCEFWPGPLWSNRLLGWRQRNSTPATFHSVDPKFPRRHSFK